MFRREVTVEFLHHDLFDFAGAAAANGSNFKLILHTFEAANAGVNSGFDVTVSDGFTKTNEHFSLSLSLLFRI